ncbi:MAG: prepilin-type N-terminal cleavage/methylation domain-containing protein [Phycisphaerae bacterium]|nr:prepilin-type N-terminal cleavage/methylation domain-containing protein [Phycisphaerae bacterium]
MKRFSTPTARSGRPSNRNAGFTLVELLVVMAIIALLLGLLLPALAKARATARQVKDGTQLTQIHKAWLIWCREFNGIFPTPGLINRVGTVPGKGAEDINQNSHANLYSSCIMANYFTPQLCISQAESSANVANAADYNFNEYNVAADKYWDTKFQTDLAGRCNTSFGTMLLADGRKQKEWKESLNSKFAVVANRGPDGTQPYDKFSKTWEIHGQKGSWEGNVCFNDNHVNFERVYSPEGTVKLGPNLDVDDNMFAEESVGGKNDMFLTMCKTVTGGGGTYTFNITWD